MTHSKALRRLCESAPRILATHAKERNRCVIATAVGIEVLARLGIQAEPWPVRAIAANSAMVAWDDNGREGDPVALGAWLVDAGSPNLPPRAFDPQRFWNGHVILRVEDMAIDLDAQQFDRPEKHLAVPPALFFLWPREMPMMSLRCHGADGATICYATRPGDTGFMRGDWFKRETIDTIASLIVRAMRRPAALDADHR